MHDILKRLDLSPVNPGTWLGRTPLEDESAPLKEFAAKAAPETFS